MKRAATTKRDAVWDHYTQEGQKWRCNYCGQLKPHRADRLRQHLLACDSVSGDVITELYQRPSQNIVFNSTAEAEAYQYVRIETVSLPEERAGETYGVEINDAVEVKLKAVEAESDKAQKRKRLSDPLEMAQSSGEPPRSRKRKTQSDGGEQSYEVCNESEPTQADCERSQHVEESHAASANLQRQLRTAHSADS